MPFFCAIQSNFNSHFGPVFNQRLVASAYLPPPPPPTIYNVHAMFNIVILNTVALNG